MESLVECLDQQHSEIQMLSSMYPSKDELTFDNPNLWKAHEQLIRSPDLCTLAAQGLVPCWSFTLKIFVDVNCPTTSNVFVLIHFSFPVHYPLEKASIYVESESLSREKQGLMNRDLTSFIETELPASEQMVLPVIDWIRENVEEYVQQADETGSVEDKERSTEVEDSRSDLHSFCVMWLYLHHIYNTEKRRNILKWAHDRELTGFSMPGKPGVVYVEGTPEDVNDYFIRLRRLSWQKMSCKQRDTFDVKSVEHARRFKDFRELALDVHENHGYHMNMGQFREFLVIHDLEYIFKELFSTKEKTED